MPRTPWAASTVEDKRAAALAEMELMNSVAAMCGHGSHRCWLASEKCRKIAESNVASSELKVICKNVFCTKRQHSYLAKDFNYHCCKLCQEDAEDTVFSAKRRKTDVPHGQRWCECNEFFKEKLQSERSGAGRGDGWYD